MKNKEILTRNIDKIIRKAKKQLAEGKGVDFPKYTKAVCMVCEKKIIFAKYWVGFVNAFGQITDYCIKCLYEKSLKPKSQA